MAETKGFRVAMVTGSATGIGRATALLLAQRGLAYEHLDQLALEYLYGVR